MYIKKNIWILYAISLLQGLVFYAPIATLYRQAAGLTVLQIAVIESVMLVLCVALELPWGLLADRIGYKKAMVLCCSLFTLSKVIFWQADSFGGFLLERILLSAVVSGLSGLDVSLLFLSCGGRADSQWIFGIYNSLGTLGMVFASVVYAVFIKENYRLAALLTLVSYSVAALLSLGLQEVKEFGAQRPLRKDFRGALEETFGNRSLLLLLAAAALMGETHQMFTVFLNQLQYVRAGLSPAGMGYAFCLMTLCGLLGGFSSRLTRRLGKRRFGSGLLIGTGAACALLAVTASPVLSVLGLVLLRLCFTLFQPLQTELQNRYVRTDNRATALSIQAILMNGAAIFMNLLYGELAELSLSLVLWTGAVFCLASVPLYALSFVRRERKIVQ